MTEAGSIKRRGGWNHRLYLPAYRFSEAARLANTTPQTLSRWFRGYVQPGHRMKPVLPSDGTSLLSYFQLIEAAFVSDFRRERVKLEALRRARDYCARVLGFEYPFAQLTFKTDGANVFAVYRETEDSREPWEQLLVTNKGGQVVWGEAIELRLAQFEYEDGLALRWHPRGLDSVILIDPRIAFGAPIIGNTGVPTWVVKDRVLAGEGLDEIEDDFEVPRAQLEEALAFEEVSIPAAA